MYTLPDHLREQYKIRLGTLIPEPNKEVLNAVVEGRIPVICIGDMVTYTLFSMDIHIDIAVVDYRTCRGGFEFSEEIRAMSDNKINIHNSAATISNEGYDTIKRAVERSFPMEPTLLIEVDGEEDLLLMPAILHAPSGAVLFYGEPGEGLVAVYPDDELKEKMMRFLGMMED